MFLATRFARRKYFADAYRGDFCTCIVEGALWKCSLSTTAVVLALAFLVWQALQYMQFHAETQLEMTQDQMERLRLSVSRAGPLQDALDNCYR